MEIFLQIIVGTFASIFWAAILSFIPTTLYLMIVNPQIYEFRSSREIGIYVLNEQDIQVRRENAQMRGVQLIYGLCFLLVSGGHLLNWLKYGVPGSAPFDILSTAAIVLFALSVLLYLPALIYIMVRSPWYSYERRMSLNRIYVGYGVGLLIFSGFFTFSWMKAHGFPVGVSNVLLSVAFVLVSAAAVAYLPVLTFIFMNEVKSKGFRKVKHPNILFIIYAVSFLLCAGIYSYEVASLHIKAEQVNNSL